MVVSTRPLHSAEKRRTLAFLRWWGLKVQKNWYFHYVIFILENKVAENTQNLNIPIRTLRFNPTQIAVDAADAVYSLERRADPFVAKLAMLKSNFHDFVAKNYRWNSTCNSCNWRRVLGEIEIWKNYQTEKYTIEAWSSRLSIFCLIYPIIKLSNSKNGTKRTSIH